MLKIHEATSETGELVPVSLRAFGGALEVVCGSDVYALPDSVLATVMKRYGAPFDPEATITVVGTLALGQDRDLRHVRHLAGYDVIARDYLVYAAPDQESLCALSTTVAAALVHLGRATATQGA